MVKSSKLLVQVAGQVWLFAIVFILLTLIIAGCNGDDGQADMRRQFQQVDVQLRRVSEAAERGDVNQAEFQFYQGTHAFLHSLDLPLRNRGEEELGERIFGLKNDLEVEFAGERRAGVIARLAGDIRALLPSAAAVLGAKYTPSG